MSKEDLQDEKKAKKEAEKARKKMSTSFVPEKTDERTKHHLSGLMQSWFLDYASSVNLDRAVPHLHDGFKPVQRRILHSLKSLDDGRYNKVANIVGYTMQFHPHGDASIAAALVNLGQKDLLIDCQGNWGNILTGDSAAASRYIEARLSKFALEVVFNPKTTEWKLSYDGRNNEPVAHPVKFPLLLAQGTEGIGVGLTSRILPHNFNELLDASIDYLEGNEFSIMPDFITGGYIDVSRYNDGERGGKVKIRAKIDKVDNKTLRISEIPYGETTTSVIESIIRANENGKIHIKKVDDNTAASVEILIQLSPGRSSDITIDALYAFTNCEVSVSPNCCVIYENKPHFLSVKDVLKYSVDNTLNLLQKELEILKNELEEAIFFLSLERIFIEQRIYKDKGFEESKSMDEAVVHIDKRLEAFKKDFIREVSKEDILRLMEIKMGRILRFNSQKAEDTIALRNTKLKEVIKNLGKMTPYTIKWYQDLKTKYGKDYPRKTEIRSFDNIVVTSVVEANEKLYIDREDGFMGTGLKHNEFVCTCSDIDDIIIFYKDGKMKVTKVASKSYIGKNVLYLAVFKRNDSRTVYNVAYRDGRSGTNYVKRFAVNSITRDKEYDITMGTEGSRVLYFTANPNGEAESIRVTLRPKPRLKVLIFEFDFSEIAIKGRGSKGNILNKNNIQRIALKQKGSSTLGGVMIWFDKDVKRLNHDKRGVLLGEFKADDLIVSFTKGGSFQTSNFDLSNHYTSELSHIEKFDPHKVWTIAFYDADQKYYYLKRFKLSPSTRETSLVGDNEKSKIAVITDTAFPLLEVKFGGKDDFREALKIDAENFIAIKGYKARGKRIATYQIDGITELEPTRFPAPLPEAKIEEEKKPSEEELDENSNEPSLF